MKRRTTTSAPAAPTEPDLFAPTEPAAPAPADIPPLTAEPQSATVQAQSTTGTSKARPSARRQGRPTTKRDCPGPCAVGYIRVSSEEQATEGVSLDAQRAKIVGWCALNDFTLLDLYADEGISAKRADNRPGLQAAIDRVCRERAALVVFKLDRMIRCTRDAIDIAEQLRKAGADLVSLSERIDTTSPMGEFFYVLMAAMAQLERRQIGERTRLALSHLRSQGRRVGRFAEFGYRFNAADQLEADPTEQAAIQTAIDLRAQGLSLSAIGEQLEAAGYVGRAGQRLSPKLIRSLLHRSGNRREANVVSSE